MIKSENIETVYYFSPTSHMVRLDELTIRALNSQFIICMDEYKWIKIISCIKGKLKIFKKHNINILSVQIDETKLSIITKEKESDILIKELHKEFII